MSSIVISGDTSGSVTLQAPAVSGSSVLTLPAVTDTVAGIAATQTLTNKTLTAPIISSISNTGTLTLPTSTDTLVGRATTDTLTNKTLTSPTLTTPVASTTIGVGAATPSASGAGITFPATQSASTDANTLDDYEEGTYTPTDASGAGLSFSSAGGFYTKIGRQVICFFYITFPSTASTSPVAIGGLPFTTGNNVAGGVFTGAIAYNTYGSFQLVGGSSVTFFNMSTPTGVDITNANMSLKAVRGSFLYFVA